MKRMSPEQRTRICKDCAGRIVKSMEFVEDPETGGYWVMMFLGGLTVIDLGDRHDLHYEDEAFGETEISFHAFMAEEVR